MSRKRIKQRTAVGILGKLLTRRAKGICELCGKKDHPFPWEIPPFPTEPDPARTLLACARCRCWLEGGEIQLIEARFLEAAVWSEEASVRLAAARLLLAVDDPDDPWVRDALETANIDPHSGELREPKDEGVDEHAP